MALVVWPAAPRRRGLGASGGPTQAAVEPATIAVARGDVEQTVLASGALLASSVTSVGAEVSGRIQTLAVKLGDVVEAGDPHRRDRFRRSAERRQIRRSLARQHAGPAQRQAGRSQDRAGGARACRQAQGAGPALRCRPDDGRSEPCLRASPLSPGSKRRSASPNWRSMRPSSISPHEDHGARRRHESSPCSSPRARASNAAQTAPTIVKIADLDTMLIKAQISEADITRVAARPARDLHHSRRCRHQDRCDAAVGSSQRPTRSSTSDTGLSASDNAVCTTMAFFRSPTPTTSCASP